MTPEPIKSGLFTTEFYLTVATTIIGILVSVNVIPHDTSNQLISAVTTIISAIFTLAPPVAYIWGRTWLKGKSLEFQVSATQPPPPLNP